MNRPYLEDRSPAQARDRALVIDWSVAKTVTWLAGTAVGGCLAIGVWIGVTVQGIDSRLAAVETANTAQQSIDTEQNRRLAALEITITGLGALRDQMDRGFLDIAKRLDRMEDSAP